MPKLNKFALWSVFLILAVSALTAGVQVKPAEAASTVYYNVTIKYAKITIDGDGHYWDNKDRDWRIASIYQNAGTTSWYVHDRDALGAHHADWSKSWSTYVTIFQKNSMKSGSIVKIRVEEYNGDSKILHELCVTLYDGGPGEGCWYLWYFGHNTELDTDSFQAKNTRNVQDAFWDGWNTVRYLIGVFKA